MIILIGTAHRSVDLRPIDTMSINCAARLSPISVGNNIRIVLLYRSVHCFQIDRAELIVQGAVQRVCSIGGNIQIVCTGRQRVTICAVKRQLTASRNVHRGTYQFAGRKILVDFYSHSAFGGIDDVNLPVTIAGIDRPRYDLIGRIGVELNRGARSYCAAYILWGGNRTGVVPVCIFAAPALIISADAIRQPASVPLTIFLNLVIIAPPHNKIQIFLSIPMVYNKNHILSSHFPDTIITTGSAVL